jgi:hypothetical protein
VSAIVTVGSVWPVMPLAILWVICAASVVIAARSASGRTVMGAGLAFALAASYYVVIVWDCGWLPDWLCFL